MNKKTKTLVQHFTPCYFLFDKKGKEVFQEKGPRNLEGGRYFFNKFISSMYGILALGAVALTNVDTITQYQQQSRLEEAVRTFEHLDADSSGTLSKEEFLEYYR